MVAGQIIYGLLYKDEKARMKKVGGADKKCLGIQSFVATSKRKARAVYISGTSTVISLYLQCV